MRSLSPNCCTNPIARNGSLFETVFKLKILMDELQQKLVTYVIHSNN